MKVAWKCSSSCNYGAHTCKNVFEWFISIKLMLYLTVTVSWLATLFASAWKWFISSFSFIFLNKESGSLPDSVYYKSDWKNYENICWYLSMHHDLPLMYPSQLSWVRNSGYLITPNTLSIHIISVSHSLYHIVSVLNLYSHIFPLLFSIDVKKLLGIRRWFWGEGPRQLYINVIGK